MYMYEGACNFMNQMPQKNNEFMLQVENKDSEDQPMANASEDEDGSDEEKKEAKADKPPSQPTQQGKNEGEQEQENDSENDDPTGTVSFFRRDKFVVGGVLKSWSE